MKSIGKLIRGELFKMLKSKTVAIMAVLLAICVGIMGAIYANYDKQVSGMMSMLFGGENRVTGFDLLDGTADDLIKEAMGGSLEGSMADFEQAFEKVRSDVRVKAMLVGVEPAVMRAMSESTTPGSDYYLFLSKDDPALTQTLMGIYAQFRQYGAFAEVQNQISGTYLEDYILKDQVTAARMGKLTQWLQNGGEYGRTVVEYMNGLADTMYASFNAVFVALDAYEASGTQAHYDALLNAFFMLNYSYSEFQYFTKSSVMGSSYLLLPTGGSFVNMQYQSFKTALDEVFNASTFTDAIKYYSEVLAEQSDQETVANFKEDFLSLYDKEYVKKEVADVPYDRESEVSDSFVSSVKLFRSSMKKSTTSLFAYDSTDVQKAFATAPSDRTKQQQDFVKTYTQKAEDGTETIDPMLPAHSLINASYAGEITEEIYDRQIRPYFDDKEKGLIDAASANIKAVTTRYSDAEMILGLFDAKDRGDFTALPDYETYYKNYRASYSEHASRVSTIRNLIVNVNLVESIAANNLNDEQAKKIQGFMMSSRYSLNSEITKAQYLISENKLASNYVTPESLGGGWGAMQFIYVLTGIVILVFGIVLGAGAIAGEHSNGTMKLLLIRPHKRWQVLIAKYIAVLIVLAAMFVLNYCITLALGAIWGYSSLSALAIFNSSSAVVMHPAVVLLLQHLFGFFEAAIFTQIALTLSTVIKSRSGAVSVSMLVYFLSFVLSSLLSSFAWYKFVIFNNTNLFMYLSSMGPSLADMNFGFSLIVDVIYIVILAVIGLFTFNKRDAT